MTFAVFYLNFGSWAVNVMYINCSFYRATLC